MSKPHLAALSLGLLLCPGCLVWNVVEARASAGSVVSKPIVHAKLTRHEERVISWGSSTTWELEVTIDQQRYLAYPGAGNEVRIAPNRRTFAVRSPTDRKWRLHTLVTQADGSLKFGPEGDPVDELAWTSNEATPPPADWWLIGLAVVSGAAAIAAGFLIRRVRSRRVKSDQGT